MDANKEEYTRGSPGSDKQVELKTDNKPTTQCKIRLATWNLGSLTGRCQELAKVLQRRDINACCIQETKWKGSKSRDIGLGYQLIYHGIKNSQNGVGIVLDCNLKQRIIKVDRKSDRLIAVKLAMDNQTPLNIISAYAPQSGCTELEKSLFWEDFDDLMSLIPDHESKYIGGDLNGHIGEKAVDYRDVHGGYGYGSVNREGTSILDFCSRHGLAIVNTWFKKKDEHLITYKSSGNNTQIDYILCQKSSLKSFKDCNVIPGEALTSQHRLLVSKFILPKNIKINYDRTPRIKWGQLYSDKGKQLITSIIKYLENDLALNYNNSTNAMWANFEKFCKEEASKHLGISKGGISTNKDPTWWNDNVKEAIRDKRELFKLWQLTKLEEDHREYKKAKKSAKQAVAQSRTNANEVLYQRLEDVKTDVEVFKIAKQRHKATLDIKVNKYIQNEEGQLLTSNEDISNRWKQYFENLLNEEFPSEPLPEIIPTVGPIHEVTLEEVKQTSLLDQSQDKNDLQLQTTVIYSTIKTTIRVV
ncbi:uncharacterized protein LOC123703012 [Colias croceus]|uniref:uncharacterized protein LOC123703012 n=1 Tax=Colias crocea TaxID=72248 RepID=UPI001E27C218|nr:uncharacterized protein LOC123703012 [Colias croceus]